ncbi:clustered mitochondria-domain-containing protein [Coniochaeta sp. 2T2.1]|nr:clustered mitochondria-domain-containing protein [Coniochaeta sp. 2T2.1]
MADSKTDATQAAAAASKPTTKSPEVPATAPENAVATEDGGEEGGEDAVFPLTIILPHEPKELKIMVSPQEQVHEVRQSIIELPAALQYSCFHLEFNGEPINDFIQISEVKGLGAEAEVYLVEDPYTEKEARVHLVRIRELIGAAGDRTDIVQGVLAGVSLFDGVAPEPTETAEANKEATATEEYNFSAAPSLSTLLPKETEPAPKTIKGISLSSWNPPPAYLRTKGHLLYLIVTTNEGEQHQITAHVGGFYVNKSSNSKFDPYPRPAPKANSAHSLLTLIEQLSPSFAASFRQLQEYNGRKDALATFQIGNSVPAAPWLVPAPSSQSVSHVPDITRTQEAFLYAGVENTDTLRDWNEEFQSARELPRDTVQDRVFRERLISKLFADYNDAATKGAALVARGEISPLNPTEGKDAQIFVYNNVFFSFGADGVGTFTSEGGDEAARVATGKDVLGVKMVNQLDIDGLYTPGTVVVDYLGKRIVGQSIVPGIFKQPEPGENQIHYGAVDGKDIVAAEEKFVPVFEKLSQALRVKKHAVWDKDGKRFDLEASVEMKGLLGTDGRKYVLDLYRITPLDISWLEETAEEGPEYPHRMTVLRPELVESLGKQKAREYVNAEFKKRGLLPNGKPESTAEAPKDAEAAKDAEAEAKPAESEPDKESEPAKESEAGEASKEEAPSADDKIDMSGFKFTLNPDVFSGQVPQTDEEKEEMAKDEQAVRDACTYLRDTVIPGFLNDLKESDISFPMDGRSLSRVLHRRGINIRYIGKLAALSEGTRLQCLREICVREMVARSFKHVASKYLKYLPLPLTSSCISHLLNCLLGSAFNPKPVADIDESLKALYNDADLAFEKVTPESLRQAIESETARRYRFKLEENWQTEIKHLQLLREVSLKLGLQLQSKNFAFTADAEATAPEQPVAEKPAVNGHAAASEGSKKKKNKKARDGSPASVASSHVAPHTFMPDDIINVVPVIKDSSPRSTLAEEALEAGRISIYNNQRKLGQELLFESLSLHEQIYGLLHPEVAQVYHTLSQIYYSLDEKEAAVELARKSVIVSERTVGIDSAETVLDYLNLSLFLHQLGDSKTALIYAKYALDLWKVIYGPDHPDTITTINNAAVMLQHLKEYHESRRWFEESLRICETVFGKQSVNAATLLFQLAQALALDHDSKGAVARMRESYNIFLAALGPEDKNTKEAESWLEQLTQNAVSIAKHAKDVQARRIRAGIQFTPRNVSVGTAATGAGQSAASAAAAAQPASRGPGGTGGIDSRSIDELIKFIEGDAKQTKKTAGGAKKRPAGRGNPKSRGGKSVSSTA